MSYGITQCYLPPDRGDSHAFTPAIANYFIRSIFASIHQMAPPCWRDHLSSVYIVPAVLVNATVVLVVAEKMV